MQQVPCRVPTNITRHHKKYSRHGDLVPGTFVRLLYHFRKHVTISATYCKGFQRVILDTQSERMI
jgi:hypothetical protein